MEEHLDIHGKIGVYEIPEWSDEELRYWWEPETEQGPDGIWRIVRPARISNGEKRSRQVLEVDNILTNNGLAVMLNQISTTTPGLFEPFSQIFSVGNGAVTGLPTRKDFSVAGDGFATGSRKVPAAFSIVGFATTLTTNFGSGDAVGTWTNAGLYGNGAASIIQGTGILLTHALLNFVKGAVPYAVSYTMTFSS